MHSCFRTALSRAFRLPTQVCVTRSTIAASLVPNISGKPLQKTFSTCGTYYVDKVRLPVTDEENNVYDVVPVKLRNPMAAGQGEPQAWVAVLERGLPPHLKYPERYGGGYDQSTEVDGRDFSYLLTQARNSRVDVLKYLAVKEGRWQAVLYIVSQITQQKGGQHGLQGLIRETSRAIYFEDKPLEEMTDSPVWLEASEHTPTEQQSLREMTDSRYDLSNSGWNLRRGGLGQIWRATGSLILAAVHENSEKSETIMQHVLQILAILHHADVVPESVYQYTPTEDGTDLQQPPTLHLLSSRILSSISDAAWNAQQASTAAVANFANAQQGISSRPAPGLLYQVRIPSLGPEVWLELVLWSCLHGPWVLDGAALLEEIASQTNTSRWSLISWRDLLNSAKREESSPFDFLRMKSFVDASNPRFALKEHEADRLRVERTISSEVIAAYVDGLINVAEVGIGWRGAPMAEILEQVKLLKTMLDRENLGLGAMSWDAIVVRFLEFEGINLEKDPLMMSEIVALAQPYQKEMETTNAPLDPRAVQKTGTYVMSATAAPLGLLHQTLRAYIELGDITGALNVFRQLQAFTDLNKRRAIEDFFKNLGENTRKRSLDTDGLFISKASALEYPNFYTKVPPGVLASFLDLIAKSGSFNFGRWLLYSKDIDGPVISAELYADRLLAPALIRFATATNDKELMKQVLGAQVARQKDLRNRTELPGDILLAFFESQVEYRKWDSVQTLLGHLRYRRDRPWLSLAASTLARELLRLDTTPAPSKFEEHKASFNRCRELFRTLMAGHYGMPKWETSRVMSILGVLSSINNSWASLCSDFLQHCTGKQALDMPLLHFNRLLEGIAEAFGSMQAVRTYMLWCENVTQREQQGPRSDAGVSRIPSIRPRRTTEVLRRSHNVTINEGQENEIVFFGRVTPRITTIRIIIQKALKEEQEQWSEWDRDEMARWVVRNLWALGLGREEIAVEVEALLEKSSKLASRSPNEPTDNKS